jgi:hypothetical protein
MLVVFHESNKLLIESIKKTGLAVIPFVYENKNSMYTAEDVGNFVRPLKGCSNIVFLINLEAHFSGQQRTDISGLYFYQCMIKEYGGSNKFNHFFYSFLPLGELLKMNSFSFIIKPEKHRQLPFDITSLIEKL